MKFLSLHKAKFIEIVIFIPLLIGLTGCGSNSSNSTSHASATGANNSTPSPSTTSTIKLPSANSFQGSASTTPTSSSTAPSINQGNVSLDADGLHIQSADEIECAPGIAPNHTPPNHLVLANDPTSYTSNDLQQISSYLDVLSQTDETTNSIANLSASLPSSLNWAAGATIGGTFGSICQTGLQITNTGSSTIQIPQAAVRLSTSPKQNTYSYHLIDACSFLSKSKCQCGGCGGAGGDCTLYTANIQLGLGQQDTVFSTSPTAATADSSCGQLTIAPNKSIYLNLYINPPSSAGNLVYSFTTELTLDSGSGQQILSLPQLGNTLAFADQNQFTCYGLQGQNLVQVDAKQASVQCI